MHNHYQSSIIYQLFFPIPRERLDDFDTNFLKTFGFAGAKFSHSKLEQRNGQWHKKNSEYLNNISKSQLESVNFSIFLFDINNFAQTKENFEHILT